MWTHRVDHLAGEGAGLDERAESPLLLVPQQDVLLDHVRGRRRAAAQSPSECDALPSQRDQGGRDGYSPPPALKPVDHGLAPADPRIAASGAGWVTAGRYPWAAAAAASASRSPRPASRCRR